MEEPSVHEVERNLTGRHEHHAEGQDLYWHHRPHGALSVDDGQADETEHRRHHRRRKVEEHDRGGPTPEFQPAGNGH